ncbi:unnamed protein product, partial [Phaeothamnion confervicola]
MSTSFDYLVIGGGSGGIASARRAASYGAKVALIESTSTLGGTCVNVGCVPKKIMFNTATINEILHGARHYGYDIENYSFDWGKIKEARDAYIKKLNGIYGNNLKNSGVTLITGTAAFVGPKTVKVDDVEYSAEHVLVAVGGRPMAMDGLPGAELTIDSNGFFALEEQPDRVAVVGAGYIAVEMAGIFNALGTNTHLFVRHDRALRKFDTMLQDTLDQEMKKAGMHVHPHWTTKRVYQDEETGKYMMESEDGKMEGPFDVVLMAIGREPQTRALNLEAAGVDIDSKGYVTVDPYQQNTNAPGVYALGDVAGQVELTPMAIAAGRRLADRLFGGIAGAKADYDNVPSVIFSHPTIGTVGLTEAEARAEHGDDAVKVYMSRFTNLFYGHWQIPVEDKQKTAMKVICVGEEERVVGLHIIGMGADEMLQGFGVAVRMGCTKVSRQS